MRVIAIEEHFTTEPLMRAEGRDGGGGPLEQLLDLGAGRLAEMDAAGIDVQVLSTRAPAVHNFSPAEAVPLAGEVNDVLADAVAAHPDRFAALATLPVSAPEQAAAELDRAVSRLGFTGAILHGHAGGRFLDDTGFWPIFECAEALGVPVYLHPTPPPPEVFNAYFRGLEPRLGGALARAGWGWHAETGLHALRLIVSGLFDRFPALQVVLGHMGEGLPLALARSDTALRAVVSHLDRTVTEYVQQNFHVTTSAFFTVPPLQLALAVMGADRIMFSVDYPFASAAEGVAFLRSAPISEADREKIAHLNAERLLRL